MVPYCRIPAALGAPFCLNCVKEEAGNGSGLPPPDTIRFYAAAWGRTRFWILEQVHVRGIFCRSLRLELVAGLGIALAASALAVVAAHAQGVNTTTTLTAQSSEASTCSLTTLSVAVTANAGIPAGTVTIEDEAGNSPVQLATAALDTSGKANFSLALGNGNHSLSAVYAGDATFSSSTSAPASVPVTSQCDSTFVVSISNLGPSATSANALTLIPGQAGTGTITVTPLQSYVSSLTAPAFITISCSGLPDTATCAFTPENVEILPGQNAGVTSAMMIQTVAASTTTSGLPANRPGQNRSSIAWAFLLPGVLGLGGLAWGARRRKWLARLSLVALVGLVTLLGTTGCNPRYNYEHHGPVPNPATPAGTYTVTVTAQSSNGVTATLHSTSFVLTVK
jgi:hypothetical protein